MSVAHPTTPVPENGSTASVAHRFVFERDRFTFANELLWEYQFDAQTGRMTTLVREPKPDYVLRCFVLTAAARKFFQHATFASDQPRVTDGQYRSSIRQVLARSPRHVSGPEQRVVIPGFDGLRSFSAALEPMLKAECGGAWRSYVLRSHWRMIFPISRRNQAITAARLQKTLANAGTAVVHLVRFPSLTINHGVLLFGSRPVDGGIEFDVYDPNAPQKPTRLIYHAATRTFSFPANAYWSGRELNVIEIYRNWFI
jgi:hypothetical protein